ncbi:hypothetical protein FB45DRAFT_904903 [Roridomyces roridus]|uniref:Fungal-type protein kinase domain-containing protein n=1 Tax=Roridomyces roridus TaxID=1738132 RepID=A0AAD7C530_9AGAR|nr:hypothetical protein FB45DRAFT_904903 [Roridomyces roridus]
MQTFYSWSPPRTTKDSSPHIYEEGSPPTDYEDSDDSSSCFSEDDSSLPQEDPMVMEIGAHTWQFPNDLFTQMVSHKVRKSPAEILLQGFADYAKVDRLVYYTSDTVQPWFQDAFECGITHLEVEYNALPPGMHEPTEENSHDFLRRFLKLCLLATGGLYTLDERPCLTFHYGDGINDTEPLKPNLTDFRLYWKAPLDDVVVPIPIVVESNWAVLLQQATQDARSLFAASPLRRFALVFAWNHHCRQFRFLLYHRGGISASYPFDPRTTFGRRDIFQVILALRTCRNWEDLGFPAWHKEQRFRLPVDEHAESFVSASSDDLIHADGRLRGRATHVYRLSYSPAQPLPSPSQIPTFESNTRRQNGRERGDIKFGPIIAFSRPLGPVPGQGTSNERVQAILKASWVQHSAEGLEMEVLAKCAGFFGCQRLHYSFLPITNWLTPATNHLFLPVPEEAADGDRLATFHWNDWTPEPLSPPAPQLSSLFVHITSPVGSSFTLSPTPRVLMMAIVHAMLGWLSIFQAGFLHRDISIGNLLLLLPSFMMEEPFSVDYTLLGNQHATVERQAVRLKDLLAQLGVDLKKADAFVIDTDMAVRWPDLVDVWTQSPPVGTVEFMSPAAIISLERNTPHLRSPTDDLYSFFYLAQWAAVFHPSADHLPFVKGLRDDISGPGRSDGTNEIKQLTYLNPDLRYGLFLNFLGPVFKDWLNELDTLAVNFDVTTRGESDVKKLRAAFFASAYQGVADLIEVICKHEDSLASYRPMESSGDTCK